MINDAVVLAAKSIKPEIIATDSGGVEVVRIDCEGRIYWRRREVETDADFKGAMLELVKHLQASTSI